MATAKQNLDLAIAVLQAVEKHCVQPDGTVSFNSVQADVALGNDVEAAYKAQGGSVPVNVDKALAGAEAFLAIMGLK